MAEEKRMTEIRRVGRIVGSALFIAPLMLHFFNLSNHYGFFEDPTHYAEFNIAMACGTLVCAFVCTTIGLTMRERRGLGNRIVFAGACCFSLGYIGSMVVARWLVYDVLIVMTGVLFGMGAVIVGLVWCLSMPSSDMRVLFSECAISVILGVGLVILLDVVPEPFMVVMVAALALIELFLTVGFSMSGGISPSSDEGRISFGIGDDQDLGNGKPAGLLAIIAVPMVGLFVYSIQTCMREAPFQIAGLSASQIGLIVSALLILLMFRLPLRRDILPVVYWICLPMIATILLFLGSLPQGVPSIDIAGSCSYIFLAFVTLFALFFIVLVIGQGEFSPLFSVGVVFMVLALTFILDDLIVGQGLSQIQQGELMSTLAAAYYLLLIVNALAQLWRMRHSFPDETMRKSTRIDEIITRCSGLAGTYGLSPREQEILVYLARGYNSTYIASALVISDSTVRTHVKRIYSKLGVSSQMEVIDLMQEPADN